MGGCALCHPRRSRCKLDGARGARQGSGGGVGDSSDGEVVEARVRAPTREEAWIGFCERHVGLLMLGRAPEVPGPGQVSEGAGLSTLWPSRLQAVVFTWQGLQAPCEVMCLSATSHCIVTLKTPSTHCLSSAPPAFPALTLMANSTQINQSYYFLKTLLSARHN